MRHSTTSRGVHFVLTVSLCAGILPGLATGAEAPPTAPPLLPDVEVRSLSASKDVQLARELAGKPAFVLLTDGIRATDAVMVAAATELQREYATWFSWVAVASGPLAAADVERLRGASPVRLDRFYLDRHDRLREALGITRLPVLLLVDEGGGIRESLSPGGAAAGLQETAQALWNLAGPSRWRNAGIEDFRLPRVGGGEPVSFLDVAGRDGTMVAFLNSRCLACARELEVLDFARHRRGGRVSFVAVFIDPATDSRLRGVLAAAGATPDFVLRDTELQLAGRYAIRSAPAILVIDTLGGIVFTKTGYRESEREQLYGDLVRAFEEAAPAVDADSAIAEASRLNKEAGAFMREGKPGFALLFQERIRELLPGYPSVHLRIAEAALAAGRHDLALESLTRYLAAEPVSYDGAAVRQMLAGLAAAVR